MGTLNIFLKSHFRILVSTIILMILGTLLVSCNDLSKKNSIDPTELKVARLIDETVTTEERQLQAFKELEAMGDAGAPYLVKHLYDMRPLASTQISLVNHSPNRFEMLRNYAPQVVHDALSAILNQITGENFEIVYNGATAETRKKNRVQWVTWCRSHYVNNASACGSAEG